MGKRKDNKNVFSASSKKSKKAKKHKRKKERSYSSEQEDVDVVTTHHDFDASSEEGKCLKLKIKLGGQTISRSDVISESPAEEFIEEEEEEEIIDVESEEVEIEEEVEEVFEEDDEDNVDDDDDVDDDGNDDDDDDDLDVDDVHYAVDDDGDDDEEIEEEIEEIEEVEETKEAESDSSVSRSHVADEEEKWLDALDKGELDDNGDIRKKKNKQFMTARQRALHGEASDYEMESLQQLPMYPEKSVEEELEIERKRQLQAKKRKQQLQKQIEETKAQTIEKLLKGQKSKKDTNKQSSKEIGEHVRYISNQHGFLLAFTQEMECPIKFEKQERPAAIPRKFCSVDGCNNLKKYACSKTNRPVCSLQCYKLVNMAASG